MKIPLTTGAYQARSLIANAQRCVNCYPEANPQDSEFPTTHYPRPGLARLSTAPLRGFRALYPATSGELYAVVGTGVYRIGPGFDFNLIGALNSVSGSVSMVDNSLTLVIVDGSPTGYTVDLVTHGFAMISDPAFYGSDRVAVVDDFLLFNQPDTRQFYVSGALAVTFDALDIASKNGAPDKTVGVAVVNRTIFIFGERTTEVWYNSGDASFVFARYPGVFIQHGCASAASIATIDTSAYWLSADDKGAPMIFRTSDMNALRISTHALEHELKTYSTLSDAFGYCYEDEGHTFYVLTFPSAEKTWCFDLSTNQWHERLYLEADGTMTRDRAACFARWNGKMLVGDYETGDLYEMTSDVDTDAGNDILCIRSFAHISNEDNRTFYTRFIADMEVGEAAVDYGDEPQVRLRWSDTRGRSWGTPVSVGLGNAGEFHKIVQFNRLGSARDRVFELSWSARVRTALNGAYIEAEAGR